ncbi:MAG TPA: 2-hydroxyacid dehydrogenase [Stellaceae bacterium]|jgi:lactate dehydrogenase-like 2-hydroxyacid dehydrogenase|nr:2-hydroxyacid dehydrogenase [Stellaceae bacterium]
MKPDVLAATPLYAPVMEQLQSRYTVHRLFEADDRAGFLARVQDKTTAIATFGGAMDAKLMDALPKLKLIACMSVGVDNVDLVAAKARGIQVTNAPDVLTDDVADIAIALLIGVARNIVQADRYLRAGHWVAKSSMPLASKLAGSTMGVLGLGRIGLAIAQRAEALGVKIAYHGPRQKAGVKYRFYADLVEMATDVDYLMVACPGGEATRHLVNGQVIAALGEKGAIINIARGSVIDETMLVAALTAGKLRGAGLDVFANEPRVPAELIALDNVTLLPHIGSATHATRRAMGQLMLDNLAAFFAGQALLTPVV